MTDAKSFVLGYAGTLRADAPRSKPARTLDTRSYWTIYAASESEAVDIARARAEASERFSSWRVVSVGESCHAAEKARNDIKRAEASNAAREKKRAADAASLARAEARVARIRERLK